MSTSLTVTAKGQITLKKDVLRHLGVRPGDCLEIDLLPGGGLQLRPKPAQPIENLFGILKRPGTKIATIEEMNEAAAEGWAGLF